MTKLRACAWLLLLSATATHGAGAPSLVRMEADLAELVSDFNAAADQVRLVFIVGPT